MKTSHSHSIFLALLILLISPLTIAHASPSPADSAYFCLLPFDYEQGQRGHNRPAAKWLSDCAFCDLEDAEDTPEEEGVLPSGKAQATLEAPPAPTNLRFEAVTDSSCRVRWDAAEGATDYDVNYRPAVGGKWTNEPHKGIRLYNTIYDLEPNTEYRWAARAENSDGPSEWVFGPNFTTAEEETDETTDSRDDHSNTRSGATELSLGISLAGQIETGSDVDYFSVQVGESGTLTVYTTGSLDTKGTLENSSGSRLASNDDGDSDTNFRIEGAVSAGTYYIKVESYRERTGSYTIHANETPEEAAETDSESSEGGPDLIVQSPSASAVMLTPGQAFTLQITVHNQGDEQAAATMLHYYRSDNATISASDTEVGTDAVDALDASATSEQSIALTASVGVEKYYGACVASVSGESNTDNNCSSAVKITVSGQETSEDDDGSGEVAAESSEDVTEDFFIPEPSLPPRTVRRKFGLTSFYQQWVDVEGFPVVASEKVNPYAVKEAAWMIRRLMSHRPDVLQAMVQNKTSHSVIAYNEMITQIPEHSHLRPDFYWDRRSRGLGDPVSSCGEENLLNYPGDPLEGYNMMIHEFAHNVHLEGLKTADPDFDNRLKTAFEAALAKGLWKGTYASSNRREYWAEGVQAWFNAHFESYDINTRTKLKDYDPELAKLIAEVFGDTDWLYTPATTRTHLPHLQGFNPQDSPTFEWPPDLEACYQQLREPDGDGGDKWINLEPYDLSQLSRLRSPNYETGETEIIFVNTSGALISYYWIDFDGKEIYFSHIPFGEVAVLAYIGHIWLIKDQHGNDLAVFRAKGKTGRVYIGPAQAKLVAQESISLLDVPQLQQNAPNPFNSQTILSYFLPTAGPARMEVFALTGQRVATLRQGPQSAGHHQLHWNGLDAEGRPLASGIYLYRLTTDFGVLTRKLMLLR